MYICQEDGGSAPDTDEASYLLVLTHSRATKALTRARSRRPPLPAAEASMASEAIGIALRDWDAGHAE